VSPEQNSDPPNLAPPERAREQAWARGPVWEQVQPIAPSLSPSTVYRTLELLEELGVVAHTHLGHGAPSYHLATHADHIHLVCRRCGDVQTADVRRAQQLADEVIARYGFVTDVGDYSHDHPSPIRRDHLS